MAEEKPLEALMNTWHKPGTVRWIGLRPMRKAPLDSVASTTAIPGRGLEGDRATQLKEDGKRQVTLIQAEHIRARANMLDRNAIDPGLLRRNIVVEGINLISLKNQQIKIGEAILEITGPCHPCSRMEENLGPGGYNAMRGHGGWCAKVIDGGTISTGDPVEVLPKE